MSKKQLGKKLLGSLVALAAVAIAGAARADDAPGSAIHGFADISIKNDYITPRGLLVTNKGLTTQIDGGLVFDLYNNKGGTLTDVSAVVGIWNDLYSKQNNSNFGPWNEFDWFTGVNFQFSKITAGVTFVDFISPPGSFRDEKNLEFSLSYSDDPWGMVSFHPYAKLFYAMAGSSTVVTGKAGNTFDVELGLVPTIDFKPMGTPITLTFPTWITVGPKDYWGGKDNFGVVSTGINLKTPINFIPPKFGSWSFNIGAQYYNILNSSLLNAQVLTVGSKHRNVGLISTGIGLSF